MLVLSSYHQDFKDFIISICIIYCVHKHLCSVADVGNPQWVLPLQFLGQ